MALTTKSKTILVVDDEPAVLKYCGEMLKRGGYTVLYYPPHAARKLSGSIENTTATSILLSSTLFCP